MNKSIPMQSENRNKKFYISFYFIYTISFIFTVSISFFWFVRHGNTLISSDDGWYQHFKSLLYYSHYSRNLVKNILINHQFAIPEWDFHVSEGADILQTFHYYAIGDPFAFFAFLIPDRYMYHFYDAMLFLRLYIAGITFSILCFKNNHFNRKAVLAGAMSYSFATYSLVAIAAHPFFLTPLVFLPLVILGVESIFHQNHSMLYVIVIAFSAISNFYFFYMTALITVGYCVFKALFLYGTDFKKIAYKAWIVLAHSILGISISAVVLIPMGYIVLTGSRDSSSGYTFDFLYNLGKYKKYISDFVLSGDSGFTVAVLLAVIILFISKNRDTHHLKWMFIFANIVLLLPICGYLMNGFAYVSNRWAYGYTLLCAYILVSQWNSLFSLTVKSWIILISSVIVYFILCFITNNGASAKLLSTLPFVLLAIIVASPLLSKFAVVKTSREYVVLFTVILNIGLLAMWNYSNIGSGKASGTVPVVTASEPNAANEIDTISKYLTDSNSYVRYTGRAVTLNQTVLTNLSSTQFYWSLPNSNVSDFRKALEMMESWTFHYKGYDDRTELIALSGCSYYCNGMDETRPVPYGFTDISDPEDYIRVYNNDYSLPMGYTYDEKISDELWRSSTALEKQKLMMHAVHLSDESDTTIPTTEFRYAQTEIPYSVECSDKNCYYEDGMIVVTKKGATLNLSFEGLSDTETYLELSNLWVTPSDKYDLYFSDSCFDPTDRYSLDAWNKLSKSKQEKILRDHKYKNAPSNIWMNFSSSNGNMKEVLYFTEKDRYYAGRNDFLINLGYDTNGIQSAQIYFTVPGIYRFDSMKVLCEDLHDYPEQIEKLSSAAMNDFSYDIDYFSGHIDSPSSKVLCIAIPYVKGWKATIDGVDAPIMLANEHYMAISLPEGEHFVEFRYRTPFLRLGLLSSVIGIATLIYFSHTWFRQPTL